MANGVQPLHNLWGKKTKTKKQTHRSLLECSLTFDSQADLVGHMTHLADGVGQVIVFFEEIKSTESQELKTDTHMAMIVEPVKHLHTQTKNREREK